MKRASFTSDYSPSTKLNIVQAEDGDICIDIYGDGEFRIATCGGHLHGERLTSVIRRFSEIIDLLNAKDDEEILGYDENGFSDYWEEN